MTLGLDLNHTVGGQRVRLESGRVAIWARFAIRAERDKGAGYLELVRKYQITEEGIRRIVHEEGPTPMQRRSRAQKASHALKNREET